jgi:hypothetical protein
MRNDADDAPALTLLSERQARSLLGKRPTLLRVVRPPFPALGRGVLRVLRAREVAGTTELAAGYERYERIAERAR